MTATPTRLYKGTPPAPATPSIRNNTSSTGTFGASTFAYTLPSYAVGDTVVIIYGSGSTMSLATTGWTRYWGGVPYGNNSFDTSAGVVYKTMTDTTATSVTFNVTNGATYSFINAAFANSDTPVPMGAVASYPGGTSTLPSVGELFYNGGIYVSSYYGNAGSSAPSSSSAGFSYGSLQSQGTGRFVQMSTAGYTATTAYQNVQTGAPATTTASGISGVHLFMSNTGWLNVPAGSTLYTATSKTIITSISAGAGLWSRGGTSGKLRLQIAGTEYMRDLDVGNGRYQLINPTHVIESGETIVGMTDSGIVPVIISGVVIT